MLEYELYYMIFHISIPTKQKMLNKISELEIPHFMQCQWTLFLICIFLSCFLNAQL